MASYKPATWPKSFKINLGLPPMLTQLVPSPTGQPTIRSKKRSGSGIQHDDPRSCTQATERRKLAVLISNLRFPTGRDGASGVVSELLSLGCLSILRQEENGSLDHEKSLPAVADNTTRMRADLQSRTFEPTEA